MIDKDLRRLEIASDLSLDCMAAKGQVIGVRKCWHFYTAGESVEAMFYTQGEFCDGMNRILAVIDGYEVMLLAFVLMDTHVHFVLYGELDSCTRFVYEYVRRTSMYLTLRHKEHNALGSIEINHQKIDDDRYLKTAICSVIKNPVSAGLPYNPWDYPWSSGPLYFSPTGSWTSPRWTLGTEEVITKNQDIRKLAKSRVKIKPGIRVIDGIIVPNQFVAVDIVEKLFRSHKAYNFFMSTSRDIDVESRAGAISHLTLPISEMRENRRIILQELFCVSGLRGLNVPQRLRLALCMKSRYNCSPKQIAKLCGLVYDEVKDYL